MMELSSSSLECKLSESKEELFALDRQPLTYLGICSLYLKSKCVETNSGPFGFALWVSILCILLCFGDSYSNKTGETFEIDDGG